jgi:hypothetical protein
MTIIHIGELLLLHTNPYLTYEVGIKSSADRSAQSTLISSFEALAEKCVNEQTGKPLITSFKCGKQNSPEGMTKGLEMIFVLEFEVCPYPLALGGPMPLLPMR